MKSEKLILVQIQVITAFKVAEEFGPLLQVIHYYYRKMFKCRLEKEQFLSPPCKAQRDNY